MEEKTIVVEKTEEKATAPQAETSTVTNDDAEARIAQLEADKAKLITENANYKLGILKAKGKKQDEDFEEETEEERIARIVQEKLTQTKISQIDSEKEELLKKLAKENKELKLAQLNKTNTPPASIGTHSEAPGVQDTLVTPEQLAAFKKMGWDDKDIERYKANLRKYGGR